MNCLLTAATANEIAPFLSYYRESPKQWQLDINIDVLITGPGVLATSHLLTRQFGLRRPDIVIQAGIAGCFDKNISLGSVVVIKQDRVADEGVFDNKKWMTMADLKLISPNQDPFRNGWLVNPDKGLLRRSRLSAVKGITVNTITTSSQMNRIYMDRFQPVIESMEGAVLHYVCLKEKTNFLQVRAISNYVGERNKKKWKIKEAVSNLNNELIRLLESL